MAFKLTYSDGHETDYDDETKWEVENGVVKMGSEEGKWTVFISPSHWATLELTAGKDKGEGKGKDKDKDKDEDKDKDKDEDKDKDKDKDEDKDGDDDDADEDKDKDDDD
jgi:hypothetical protein